MFYKKKEMVNSPQNRILYLDILRAFAIFMMLQGHTIHVFLSKDLKDFDSVFYSAWYIIRGFTGPIFMFTSGVVFTYLLTIKKITLKENPRIKKGIKRGISLILIGYILRYPTYKIIDFSDVTHERWLIFFSVDALHLIGVGLLLILILEWISSKTKTQNIILFASAAVIAFLITPWVNSLNLSSFMPIPFASYFTFEYGSIFPLFPYLQYMFVGALIGSVINKHPEYYNRVSSISVFMFVGVLLIAASRVIYSFMHTVDVDYYSQTLNRIGIVLILNCIFAFTAMKVNKVPSFVLSLAKNSLIIYVVHLVILYGSPWSLGIYQLAGERFSVPVTILSTLIMITLMILISLRIDKFRIEKREVVN